MTSQPIPVSRGLTFGSPRPRREARVRAARIAVAALVTVGTGPTAWDAVSARIEQARAGAVTSVVEGPSAQSGPVDPHAPTGSDDLEGLQPRMRASFEAARDAAAAQGITIEVVSAHRDAATQQQLYDQAIARYGSAAEARKWVLPPDESEHVKGGAIDVAPRAAAQWLETNGVRFGLCRRYANEWWHFERLAGPKGSRCPKLEPYAGAG